MLMVLNSRKFYFVA